MIKSKFLTQKYIFNLVHTIKVLSGFQYFESDECLSRSEKFCIVGTLIQIFSRSKKRKISFNERFCFGPGSILRIKIHAVGMDPRDKKGINCLELKRSFQQRRQFSTPTAWKLRKISTDWARARISFSLNYSLDFGTIW